MRGAAAGGHAALELVKLLSDSFKQGPLKPQGSFNRLREICFGALLRMTNNC